MSDRAKDNPPDWMRAGILPPSRRDGLLFGAKLLINKFLRSLGYEVCRYVAPSRRLERLVRLGAQPRTLIDVGVGHGTPMLYDTYPSAYLVLVEPLREFESEARRVLSTRRGELHRFAAGEGYGRSTILVDPDFPERSSLYPRNCVEETGTLRQREIEVVPLDSLFEAGRWEPPFVLKIDTEGFEDLVVRGATRLLDHCELVIAEVSVVARFVGGYHFADFIRLLDERGFETCDILDVGREGSRSDTIFFDLVFQRRGSGARERKPA